MGLLGNRRAQLRADAAEPLDVVFVGGFLQRRRPPFGNAPSATTTMLNLAPHFVAGAEPFGDDVEVKGDLGDQNGVGSAGDTRIERNPSRVPAHDLDNHDPVVRFRRRMQAVDRVGGERDGGVEAEAS